MRRIARLTTLAAALIVAGVAAWWTLPALSAARLLVSLAGQPAWAMRWAPPTADVTHQDLELATRHGLVAARAYRPPGTAQRTLVVVPGIHAGGVEEPRLADLSRRLAASGALVVAVPLPELRRYVVTPRSTDVIEDAVASVAGSPDLAPDGTVGLVGVSFAGGLAVVAAGRPSMADRLTAVISIGGHGDLPRAMRYMATGQTDDGEGPPPHDYGVAVVLLGAADQLVPAGQVAALRETMTAWLDAGSLVATDAAAARARLADAERQADALDEPSRTLARLALARDSRALGARVLPYVEALGGAPALSPERSPAPRVPVFLLHGAADPLIPPAEAARLADYLGAAGTPVERLVTPLLRHAEVASDVSARDAWALLRFWTGILAAT